MILYRAFVHFACTVGPFYQSKKSNKQLPCPTCKHEYVNFPLDVSLSGQPMAKEIMKKLSVKAHSIVESFYRGFQL